MNENILVIDPEPDIRTSLESLLMRNAYQVTSVSPSENVLETFKAQSFDLVIADINMPGRNGLEMIKAIKQLDASTKIIVLTGQTSVEDVRHALRHETAFDFLGKPLENPEDLIISVKQALGKRSMDKGEGETQ